MDARRCVGWHGACICIHAYLCVCVCGILARAPPRRQRSESSGDSPTRAVAWYVSRVLPPCALIVRYARLWKLTVDRLIGPRSRSGRRRRNYFAPTIYQPPPPLDARSRASICRADRRNRESVTSLSKREESREGSRAREDRSKIFVIAALRFKYVAAWKTPELSVKVMNPGALDRRLMTQDVLK